MKIILANLFFTLFLTLNAQNVIHIDLTQAKFGETPANKIFEEIRYIPLETHKGGLLKVNSASYYLTDKYIIAMNRFKGAYLFDRETGKFIREISSFGQGPNEYSGILYNEYGFDEKNNILFATDAGSWKCINIETNKVESTIKRPKSDNNIDNFRSEAPWLINNDKYVSFSNNKTGKDKIRLIIFNKEGTVLKKYPNYLEYDKDPANGSWPGYPGIFYNYKGKVYFKEWFYNDTVFSVDENGMIPNIIFKLGNKQPSYYHQMNADYNKGKYRISFVHESDSFILFNFSQYTETVKVGYETAGKNASDYTGYYDKKSKQVYISSTPDLKQSGYIAPGISMNFIPMVINKNNEMVATIDPAELIKSKEKIEPEYKHLFKDMQEDDNPILIIAKLK